MPILQIDVKDKRATYNRRGGEIVCGNSDYQIRFTFDEEWDAYPVKTARFIAGGAPMDVIFEGDTVAVPAIHNAWSVSVGVFAGNLRTTTPALIPCQKSVLCESGEPADPPPDVYEQIMEKLDEISSESDAAGPNIAYGDTAPEDTTKLWVKTDRPSAVNVTSQTPAQVIGKGSELFSTTISSRLGYQPSQPACGVVGSKVYVLGGYTEIKCFDTETNAVSTVSATLPERRIAMAYATVGNKIYMFGGWQDSASTSLNTILRFDADTGTVEKLTTVVPVTMTDMTAQAVGTKIYIFGGRETTSYSSVHSNLILRFDTETEEFFGDVYESLLPIQVAGMASALVGNKIYLFGGYEKNVGVSKKIMEYDPETHKARLLETTLPRVVRCACATVAYGSEVYIIGGYDGTNTSTSTNRIYRFNADTERIEELSAKAQFYFGGGVAATVGDYIYILGGYRPSSSDYIGRLHKYGYAVPQGELLLMTGSSGRVVQLLGTPEMTVSVRVWKAYRGDQNDVGERVAFATYTSGAWSEYNA